MAENLPAIIWRTKDTGVLSRCHEDKNGKYGPGAAKLARVGEALYVLGNKGLAIFDTSRGTPTRVKKVNTKAIAVHSGGDMAFLDGAEAATVAGGPLAFAKRSLMYVAGGKGLAVFDVSSPFEPVAVGKPINTGVLSCGGGASLQIAGRLLYLAGGKGLAVFSLDDPAAPRKLGATIDTGAISMNGGVKLAVHGDRLYVVGGKGLATLSLATPEAPARVGAVLNTGATACSGCVDLVPAGRGRMLLAGGRGVAVIDVSADAPVRVGNVRDTGLLNRNGPAAMVREGDALFLAGGKGLGVFDLASPASPLSGIAGVEDGEKGYPPRAKIDTGVLTWGNDAGMLKEGDRIFVAGGNGLAVIDVPRLCAAAAGRGGGVELLAKPLLATQM